MSLVTVRSQVSFNTLDNLSLLFQNFHSCKNVMTQSEQSDLNGALRSEQKGDYLIDQDNHLDRSEDLNLLNLQP